LMKIFSQALWVTSWAAWESRANDQAIRQA
jgi:hypothetical protein